MFFWSRPWPWRTTLCLDRVPVLIKVLPPACLLILPRITKIVSGAPKTHFYTQKWTQNVCINRFYAANCPITPPDERERVCWNDRLHWFYIVWDNWDSYQFKRKSKQLCNFISNGNFLLLLFLNHIYDQFPKRWASLLVDSVLSLFSQTGTKKYFFYRNYNTQAAVL